MESTNDQESVDSSSIAQNPDFNPDIVEPPKEDSSLSKRQRKKLAKLAKWEERKREKRRQEKERLKQKKISGELTNKGPSRKALKKRCTMNRKIGVAIDLSFDKLQSDKEIAKSVKQLLRVYSLNRRATEMLPLFVTGVDPSSRTQKAIERNGYHNWNVTFNSEGFLQLGFEKDKIVYLSSESDNVLEQLEEGCLYVIGGIVDHNHQKGLCLRKAEELGVRHARLPLSEHILIKTRTVLAITHVFEIILRVSEGKPWQETLLEVLPQRKGAQPKESHKENATNLKEEKQNNQDTDLYDNEK